MPNGHGGMPGPAKVAAFQRKVGGHQHFVPGGWLQDGAIVTDAKPHSTAARTGRAFTDRADQREFTRGRHASTSIQRREQQNTYTTVTQWQAPPGLLL